MAGIKQFEFGRWKFSTEVEDRFKEFKEKLCEMQDKSIPDGWEVIYSYLPQDLKPSNEDSHKVENDYKTDSTISTDVDDEEWEDLKMYTRQLKRMKLESSKDESESEMVEEEQSLNCENLRGLVMDKEDEGSTDAFRERGDYNVFSQMSQTWNRRSIDMDVDEPETCGVVERLKMAITKDDLDTREIASLLKLQDITKSHLTELWAELDANNSARLLLCTVLANYKLRNAFLCQSLLLPWLTNSEPNGLNEIVQKVSMILPKFPDAAVKHVVVPLLTNGESAFTRNTYLLQDIMTHLQPAHWTLLLKELLNCAEIDRSCLPLLKIVIDSSDDTAPNDGETFHKLLNLINGKMGDLSKDRDFGLLIISVMDFAKRVQHVSPEIVEQLEVVAGNYKGPLRFKITNALKQLCQ